MRQGTEVEKPEHMKKVVLKMIVDNARVSGFKSGAQGKVKFVIILRCSEKHSDPLVYLFLSFPSLEHIFLCWKLLIYNSGNLLQRKQVFSLG